MRGWRMSLRKTKRAIILWHGSLIELLLKLNTVLYVLQWFYSKYVYRIATNSTRNIENGWPRYRMTVAIPTYRLFYTSRRYGILETVSSPLPHSSAFTFLHLNLLYKHNGAYRTKMATTKERLQYSQQLSLCRVAALNVSPYIDIVLLFLHFLVLLNCRFNTFIWEQT